MADAAKSNNCIKWNGPTDKDGIQLCPQSPNGPWGLTRCAFQQATTWVPPTKAQKEQMRALVQALKAHDAQAIINYADKLNLRVCRNKKTDNKKNVTDSYLVLATKPGVKNYSGPFIYFREINPSNYVHIVPHDGTDGTAPSLGLVFDRTHALASIHNGQKKDIATQKANCTSNRPQSDTAHATENLAWTAFTEMMSDPNTMAIEFHGMKGKNGRGMIITNGLGRKANTDSLLYAFSKAVAKRFEKYPDDVKQTLTVCAPGTPLVYREKCLLRDTWVQGRYLNGSSAAQCQGSKNPSNRFIGFEQGVKWVKDPSIITPVLQELEQTYPKPSPVK